MRTLSAVATIVGLLAASAARGQDAAPKVAFEVASIRPSQSTGPNRVDAGVRMDGAQAHFGSLSIKNLIELAYRVQDSQIVAPDWIGAQRYDISAKLADGAGTAQIPEMLQSLLADRFGLKIHRETKDMPAYALTLGKAPLKLKETPPDSEPSSTPPGTVNVTASGSAAGVSINLGNGSYFSLANDEFDIKKASLDVIATQLARYLDRPVVNLTGLKGNYDLTLPVTGEDYQILLIRSAVNAGVPLPPAALRILDNGGPGSLFDSIDQVGLRLEARKLPIDLIVVDDVHQKPTDN